MKKDTDHNTIENRILTHSVTPENQKIYDELNAKPKTFKKGKGLTATIVSIVLASGAATFSTRNTNKEDRPDHQDKKTPTPEATTSGAPLPPPGYIQKSSPVFMPPASPATTNSVNQYQEIKKMWYPIIRQFETLQTQAYVCSTGCITLGYGANLDANSEYLSDFKITKDNKEMTLSEKKAWLKKCQTTRDTMLKEAYATKLEKQGKKTDAANVRQGKKNVDGEFKKAFFKERTAKYWQEKGFGDNAKTDKASAESVLGKIADGFLKTIETRLGKEKFNKFPLEYQVILADIVYTVGEAAVTPGSGNYFGKFISAVEKKDFITANKEFLVLPKNIARENAKKKLTQQHATRKIKEAKAKITSFATFHRKNAKERSN